MTFLQRCWHWWRVTFRNACTDPNCTGYMRMYDNRVSNDYCSECGRTKGMIERGVKVELEDPAHPLSNYQTGGKDVVY